MAPTLYGIIGSPAFRSVYLLTKATNLNLNIKHVNLLKGEQKTPEYTKINPLQKIPALVDDDGFVVWDSHAIMTYLQDKYIQDDSLYPKDLRSRAKINQILYFECGTLFPKLAVFKLPTSKPEKKIVLPESKLEDMKDGFLKSDTLLKNKKYFAGDNLTIADFSVVAMITSLMFFVSPSDYPRLDEWLKRMETLPYYKEANQDGTDLFHGLLSKIFQK